MFYKLKITNKKVIIVDVVEEKDTDNNEFIYATKEELNMINPKVVNDYALGINNVVLDD